MTPLEHALAYAKRGWRVAPIAPGTKFPRIKHWQTKATTDPDVITTWWTRFPTDGVSIVTGAGSGLVVVDVDPRHDGHETLADLEAEHGELPDTVESITGGGGRHLLFRWPEHLPHPRNDQAGNTLGAGLDIRGEGGQIVAPPSVHAVKVCRECIAGEPHPLADYAWEVEHDPLELGVTPADMPAWMVDILAAPVPERTPRNVKGSIAGDRPGDIFERNHTWPELLGQAGWQLHSVVAHGGYELWTRPGKTIREGASASLYYRGSDVLKVFSDAAAPLQAGRTYDRWSFHVTTTYGSTDEVTMSRASGDYRRKLNADQFPATTENSSTPPTPPDQDEPDTVDDEPRRRPAIVHNGRQLDDIVAQSIDALAAANTPPHLFVRAGQLSRLRQDEDSRPLIEGLRSEHSRLELADAATWWRVNKDGERTATSPPLDVATSVLAAGEWPLPALAGVVELPVLRPDGTFHTDHGYDADTRLFHWHRGDPYPIVADEPSAYELAEAITLIDEMLCDFPWDTTADRANAWGMLLTPLVRPLIGQVPMGLVDATEPGTGKGLLVDIATVIAIGRVAGKMAWPASDEELEKKVTAALMSGATVMIFDNVEGIIKSPTLAAVLTTDSWQGRILGRSEMAIVPNRATWVATGNNIDVGGDLARRCYRIKLDAHMAGPWKRTGFKHPELLDWVTTHRGDLLHALCTIVRSWWTAGRPMAKTLSAMGGYTSWVRTIGGILEHAGVVGFLANLADFHAQADRDAQSWEAFLGVWVDEYGDGGMTAAQLISAMASGSTSGTTLKDSLPEDLLGYWDTAGFSRRLGHALRKRVGRHFGEDGAHLVEMPRNRQKVAVYAVTTRPMDLFQSADAFTRGNIPRNDEGDNGSTRDDAIGARDRGIYSPSTDEGNLSTGHSHTMDPGATGVDPAKPHNPRDTGEELW